MLGVRQPLRQLRLPEPPRQVAGRLLSCFSRDLALGRGEARRVLARMTALLPQWAWCRVPSPAEWRLGVPAGGTERWVRCDCTAPPAGTCLRTPTDPCPPFLPTLPVTVRQNRTASPAKAAPGRLLPGARPLLQRPGSPPGGPPAGAGSSRRPQAVVLRDPLRSPAAAPPLDFKRSVGGNRCTR